MNRFDLRMMISDRDLPNDGPISVIGCVHNLYSPINLLISPTIIDYIALLGNVVKRKFGVFLIIFRTPLISPSGGALTNAKTYVFRRCCRLDVRQRTFLSRVFSPPAQSASKNRNAL